MSARDVADILTVAQAGFAKAKAIRDPKLASQSLELAAVALLHPDADAFFGGLQVALAETYEVDPMSESFDEDLDAGASSPLDLDPSVKPDMEDLEDGDAQGGNPVDAGTIPHDGQTDEESEDEQQDDREEGGWLVNTYDEPDPIATALNNLRRINT
jgi:hypothetical protein